jgi:hypothetical protein
MSIIITQDTLNYIFKTNASKLEHIMGEEYDKKAIGEDDHYYVIQDKTITNKDIPMCVGTKFEIIKHTNIEAN